ncbi:MAG: OB-fold nucleic acid binding domain-containing protein, partial [Chitinophagales bacterium]
MQSRIENSIEYLKGVGPKKAEILQKEMRIFTWGDFLTYYPYRYIDKSQFHTVDSINEQSQYIQIKGKILGFQLVGAARKKRLVARFQDDTGEIELVWFRGADWMMKSLKTNVAYVVFGKPAKFGHKYNIAHPEITLASVAEKQGSALEPMYHTSEKMKKFSLDSKGVLKLMRQLFSVLEASDII